MEITDHNYARKQSTLTGNVTDISTVGLNSHQYGKCVICCTDTGETLSNVQRDGAVEKLRLSAVFRQRLDIVDCVNNKADCLLLVHESCRLPFTRTRYLKKLEHASHDPDKPKRKLRSDGVGLNYSEMCILCGTVCTNDSRRKKKKRKVETEQIAKTLSDVCDRRDDDWAREVRGRLQHCTDLIAYDAVYHISCHKRFVKCLPKTVGQTKNGRPVNEIANAAFIQVCNELERSCESNVYTLQDLQVMMKDSLSKKAGKNSEGGVKHGAVGECDSTTDDSSSDDSGSDDSDTDNSDTESGNDNERDLYSLNYLKQRLLQRYGNHIVFAASGS
jgi:hypothetical protein